MNWLFKHASVLKWVLNLWPPYLFAGIHITHLSADFRRARVELRMRPWNRNAVGVHFGGSLFSMTDPMYMLMLMAILGGKYYVWDKAASIDYVKPGKGVVSAEFEISDHLLDEIKEKTKTGEKFLPVLPVVVKDQQGDTVVVVERTLYIKPKNKKANQSL